MIIGITGEIAGGKSTVSKILRQLGFSYINVDEIGRQIVEPGKPAYDEVLDCFGRGVLQPDGFIDRRKLGEIVFSDNEKLQSLNRITHKYIYNEVEKLIASLKITSEKIIVDAALLFEIGLDRLVDSVWYIEADKEIRLERLMKRNDFTREQALKRIESQTIWKNKHKADIIISNDGDEETLREKVLTNIKVM